MSAARAPRTPAAVCAAAVVLLAASAPLWAQLPITAPVRGELQDLIHDSTGAWLAQRPRLVPARGSQPLWVSTQATGDAIYLVMQVAKPGESFAATPIARAGTAVLKRDRRSGLLLQLKLFYRDEPGAFVRIFPAGDRSRMDVYLFEQRLYADVRVAVPFRRLLSMRMERVMAMTTPTVDWPLLLHRTPAAGDRRVAELVAAVRPQLPHLDDAEDGAMDASGRFVFIETGDEQPDGAGGFNCSGFCKWIIDGYYHPLEDAFTDLEVLRRKHTELRGNRWSSWYEAQRDPFFGLDWARNLAVTLETARTGRGDVGVEEADVRNVPFFSYVEDIGYPLDRLPVILFALAVREPGHFYIGSINREFGRDPVLRQHSHLAVLFPYFTADGAFRVVQVDRNLERSLESLARRYQGAYVHLTRIAATGEFAHESALEVARAWGGN